MQSGNSNETNDLSVSEKIKYIKDKLNLSNAKLFLSTHPFTLYINTCTYSMKLTLGRTSDSTTKKGEIDDVIN